MSFSAIIAGTGVYEVPGMGQPELVATPFGDAVISRVEGRPVVFLARHGLDHSQPPHRINYRANMWALHAIGVTTVLATYAVGSLRSDIPAGSLVVIDDFLDFTVGRISTYYDGDAWGVGHADMTMPYCRPLNQAFLEHAPALGLRLREHGTYVCKDGPRMESPAEVRMLAQAGGDVVGMTGVPEVCLARELGLHFAAVAISINLGVGLETQLHVVHDLEEERGKLCQLFLKVLEERAEPAACHCSHSVDFLARPTGERFISRACRE